jgi:hypothetical protein
VIELIGYLLGLAASLYALIATLSILWGLIRFLIEAPGAIREDLEARRRRRSPVEPVTGARPKRWVANEAVPDPRQLPSRSASSLEPHRPIRHVANEAERPALPPGDG